MPRQTTSPADYPQAVLQQIEQLAQNIVIARKRRGESQAQWAKKLGISQPTMARIERGDPSVAMASYVMCMWLINQAGGLADLIAPQHDHAALEKEVAKVKVKRKPKLPRNVASAAAPHPLPLRIPTVIANEQTLDTLPKAPAVQIGGAIRNLPQVGKAIPRMPAFQSTGAIPPNVKAAIDFQDTPTGQMIKAAIKNSAGLAALLAKSDPKKK